MKILAIDGSSLVASVAVVEDGVLLGEYTTNFKKTHSQTLLPMLDELKQMIELDLDSIDAIAVTGGPGSFTGLRIASATAKGLGLALNKPIISVPTVDALAFNMWGSSRVVCPIMDARRSQVYTGLYRFDDTGKLVVVKQQCAIAFSEIAEAINELGEPVVFLGDGVGVFAKDMEALLNVDYLIAPAHMCNQSAAAIATLASQLYAEGKAVPAADHRPDYLRLSQAERERVEKGLNIE